MQIICLLQPHFLRKFLKICIRIKAPMIVIYLFPLFMRILLIPILPFFNLIPFPSDNLTELLVPRSRCHDGFVRLILFLIPSPSYSFLFSPPPWFLTNSFTIISNTYIEMVGSLSHTSSSSLRRVNDILCPYFPLYFPFMNYYCTFLTCAKIKCFWEVANFLVKFRALCLWVI